MYVILLGYSIFGYFYLAKYKLEVTLDKIFVSSLFLKKEVKIADISSYKFMPYAKSKFYEFNITVGQSVVKIKTKYWAELDDILKRAGHTYEG